MKRDKEEQQIMFFQINHKLFFKNSLELKMYLNIYYLLDKDKENLIQFLVLNMAKMLISNQEKYLIL